ncbi:MAG: hypothetical protein ABIA63_07785 [bacterium]
MNEKINRFFCICRQIILKPAEFTKIKDDSLWHDQALIFSLVVSWMIAAFMTIAVFVIQFWPIVIYMVEKVKGTSFLIVSPVILVVILDFFVMTWVLLGGILMVLWFIGFFLLGVCMHYLFVLLGGKGEVFSAVKASFYSGAVLLFAVIPTILTVFVRFGLISGQVFVIVFYITYGFICLFLLYLWSNIGNKLYKLDNIKSYIGAFLPFMAVVLIGAIINIKLIDKIVNLIK